MPERRYPPGPTTLAALRGLRSFGSGTDLAAIPAFLTDVARRYGGIAHWTILGRHFFFLDDPALIELALVAKTRDYRKGRGIQRLKRLIGNGLLTSEEPVHLRRRRLLEPAFHRERIAGYGRAMVALTGEHIANWTDGTTLDIAAHMTRLTLAIAARTLFSIDIADRAATIGAALDSALAAFPASMSRLSELFDALPVLPVTRRFNRARATLDTVVYGIIAQRHRDPDGGADDLLAMLLAARDGQGAMDDRDVRDEALTLLLAGHETTANALSWAWYLLARQPETGRRLRDEIDRVLGGRAPDPADITRLPYTRAVFAETLRLYPPAWILGRRAIRPTTLGDQHVPRGSVVIVSPLVTGRNARYWPQPDEFRPERWLDGSGPAAKFAFFPFGGGNRRCIGEAFAQMEGVLLLATIAQRFALDAVDAEPVAISPLVTLRPGRAITVRVRARGPVHTEASA